MASIAAAQGGAVDSQLGKHATSNWASSIQSIGRWGREGQRVLFSFFFLSFLPRPTTYLSLNLLRI